jgi:hypothetical protein
MRTLITAAIVAMSSLTATAMPSFADSFTVTVGNPGYNRYHHDHRRPIYGYPDRAHPRAWDRRHPVRYDCRTKTIRYQSHGRVVTKTTRVCD